ncbi:MAG: nucleotidyltransferase family protein [Chloroflexi bacterium]|nr:nucleotidyltransferase family protein [Chloroflexota bacterium]
MRRDQVLRILNDHRSELKKQGVKSLAFFGSVARDEARPDSDVDILVEFADPPTFARYMDLKFLLEGLLAVKVDLVTPRGLKPRIRDSVAKEAIHVAGF